MRRPSVLGNVVPGVGRTVAPPSFSGAFVGAVAFAVVFGLSTGEALAQSDEEKAIARSAATEGAAALEQGRYQDALDRFTRAEAVIHAPTHLLYIARAHVGLGHLITAHETYIKIGREQLSQDAPRAFVEAQEKAAEEAKAIAARIPSVKIEVVGADAANIALTIDGASVTNATIGLARPIDPGAHAFEAKTTGGPAMTSGVINATVAEGAKDTVTLTLKPAETAPAPSPELPGPETGSSRSVVPAVIALSLGGVGIVVGTVFVAMNHSKRDEADALCPSRCPAAKKSEIQSLDNSADSAATMAWISYGVGVAALGTGAILLLTGGSKASSSAGGLRMQPIVDVAHGRTGAGLRGEF